MSEETTGAMIPYDGSTGLATSTAGYNHAWRLAQTFANSQLVPAHLQNKPHDCMLALFMAEEMGENALVVMQSIFIVKGKAGWAAQYVIAQANKSPVFRGRIRWREEGEGDGLRVTAYAILAEDGDEVDFTASMAMAKAENWTSNPKYRSMPKLMLRYRSAVFLVRLYAPEIMLGYQAAEEIETITVTAEPAAKPAPSLKSALALVPTPDNDEPPEPPRDPSTSPRRQATHRNEAGAAPRTASDKPREPSRKDLADECKKLEPSVEDQVKISLRDEHGLPPMAQPVSGSWAGAKLLAYRDALSAAAADALPGVPDTLVPDDVDTDDASVEYDDDETVLREALTKKIRDLEDLVRDETVYRLRDEAGIDYGPDGLTGATTDQLRQLKSAIVEVARA